MASSRLEKIGTIYTRTKGLLKSGALNWADRPLWYDVYEAFPPKEEPSFDKPIPNVPLRQIFCKDDHIRALFHKNNKQVGTVNLSNITDKTFTQQFIENYEKLESQYDGTAPQEQIYEEAIELFQRERQATLDRNEESEQISLMESFKDDQVAADSKQSNLHANISDILKNNKI